MILTLARQKLISSYNSGTMPLDEEAHRALSRAVWPGGGSAGVEAWGDNVTTVPYPCDSE